MRKHSVDRIVKLGLLAALTVVLVLVIPRLRLIPSLPFLEYDMGDVPIFIGAFLYGPWWGLLLTVVASVIQGVTVSAASGIIGILMHILATGSYVLVAGLIYRRMRTFSGAVIALACGTVTMILMMVPLNYFISPLFLQSEAMPYAAAQQAIWGMMWFFVAFNALKAVINSTITLFLYKSVSRILKKHFIK